MWRKFLLLPADVGAGCLKENIPESFATASLVYVTKKFTLLTGNF